ncbi:MAG: radical SAM protein [bacterium]
MITGKRQFASSPDVLLVTESDHFLPATDFHQTPSSFSPVYEYLAAPLRDLSLPLQYVLDSPQRCVLASLAGYLFHRGFSCEIADNIFRNQCESERFEALLGAHPAILGISTSSLHRIESVAAIAGKVRRLSPSSVIVMGGCGLNFAPGMSAYADIVVAGDGEIALGEILEAVKSGRKITDMQLALPSVVTKEGNILLVEGRRDFSAGNLPAWAAYKKCNSTCFPVETSKGCRHSCVFCSYPERGNQDYRPIAQVINELRYLIDDMGAKYVRFIDTNLTSDPGYVKSLCNHMEREKLKIPWSCFARIDDMAKDRDMCLCMADAGCFWIYSGIESGDPGMLERMDKEYGLEDIEDGVKNAGTAGIAVHGNFVMGFPGETEATVRRTYEMIKRSGIDTVSFTVLGITASMAEMSVQNPEKYGHMTRYSRQWRHSTMDFESALRSTNEIIHSITMETDKPLIAAHGIAMYYLLGAGIDFAGVTDYFSAIRGYHRAKAGGNDGDAKACAARIRDIYAKTACNFGWPQIQPQEGCIPGFSMTGDTDVRVTAAGHAIGDE